MNHFVLSHNDCRKLEKGGFVSLYHQTAEQYQIGQSLLVDGRRLVVAGTDSSKAYGGKPVQEVIVQSASEVSK